MKKSLAGENTVLTLTIPKAKHQPAYQQTLQRVATRMTIPGFRKGKAPITLVESQVNRAALLDDVLEAVLPPIYATAVKERNLTPLVAPQIKVVAIEPNQDWIIEAHTAVAPIVELKDWEKTVKNAVKDTKDLKDEELLSKIFAELIKTADPKIAPLLVEHEVRRQIEEFARHLASHRLDLDQYLKSTGKTIETLQAEYVQSSQASLQIEFVLQALSEILKPEITPEDLESVLGKDLTKYPKESLDAIQEEAKAVAKRRKTTQKLLEIAKQ